MNLEIGIGVVSRAPTLHRYGELSSSNLLVLFSLDLAVVGSLHYGYGFPGRRRCQSPKIVL